MRSFTDKIKIIGINPYVIPPQNVLSALFKQCGRSAGPIPIRGTLNGNPFIQTLVKYRGKWRLYLNTPMRRAAGIVVGDLAKFKVEFDPRSRTIRIPNELQKALQKNAKARKVFNSLPASRRKEIIRYIAHLKQADSIKRNIVRAIRFLNGNDRFAGRDTP